MSYAVASGLKGFRVDSLRVRIVRWADETTAIVRTADLLDAGTPLALDRSQLTTEDDAARVEVFSHRSGLVSFAG